MKTFQEFRKDTSVNEGWGAVPGIARDMIGGTIGNKIYNDQVDKRKNEKYSTKTKDYTAGSGSVAGDITSYAAGSTITNQAWKHVVKPGLKFGWELTKAAVLRDRFK